jgi:hypothetical protein
MALGTVLRVLVAQQPPFADELATFWVVGRHDFFGVIETVHSDAEITPPLYFVLAKFSTQIDSSREMMRLPSLAAGVASIPLVYLVGRKTVGRRGALAAAALVTFSPFMVFYSTEARGYALMVALVLGSTLALLNALEGRGRRWWLLYAVLSAGCMYTHYTAAFALAAQALWALWAHPDARRHVIGANALAAVLFLPWVTGLIADFRSPTTEILDALAPFDAFAVRTGLEHWLVGYPYRMVDLTEIPGVAALVAMAAGVLIAAAVAVGRYAGDRGPAPLARRRSLVLVIALALALPVGTALASALSINLWGTRNLAASLPAVALLVGALVAVPRTRISLAAALLLIGGFGIGAARMLDQENQRPDLDGIAAEIERQPAGTAVIDSGPLTPGPLTGLDFLIDGDYPVLRLGQPQQADHPFDVFDRVAPPSEVAARAARLAAGGRLIIVTQPRNGKPYDPFVGRVLRDLPPSFEIREIRRYPSMGVNTTLLLQDTRRG